MAKGPSDAVARAARAHSRPNDNADKLIEIRKLATLAMDTEKRIEEKEQEIKDLRAGLNAIYYDKMPSLMVEAGVDTIGVAASGNSPGFDYDLSSVHSASISTEWPEERQEAAFAGLRRLKAEALIRAKVSAALPKGKLGVAMKIQAYPKKPGVKCDTKISVHHGTLSAWLRELYEDRRQSLSSKDLEAIGGFVGRVVKPKERKE